MKFSTRLMRKGALISEARAVLAHWQPGDSVAASVQHALEGNPIGARSERWLIEIRTSLSSRLGEVRAPQIDWLTALAQSPVSAAAWAACLHWHWADTDILYRRYAVTWLYRQFESGVYRLRTEDALPFVVEQVREIKGDDSALSQYGALRAARDCLRMSADFGILVGGPRKEFASYHLPEESFMYLLHALAEQAPNARRIVEAEDWRLFLMAPTDVERELLRLHQFRKVHYEVAGSLAQIKLPYASTAEYVRSLSA